MFDPRAYPKGMGLPVSAPLRMTAGRRPHCQGDKRHNQGATTRDGEYIPGGESHPKHGSGSHE